MPLGEQKKLNTTSFCIPQVAAAFALSGNGKECFNPILDPDADLNHRRNLITSILIQFQ